MSKVLTYAVGILLALSLALGYGLKRQITQNGVIATQLKSATDALEQAEAQRKKDVALLARLNAEKRSERLQSATSKDAVKQAVQAAPEWAATTTPPTVQKALSEALDRPE